MSNRFNRIIRNFTYPLNELNVLKSIKSNTSIDEITSVADNATKDTITASESFVSDSVTASDSLFTQFVFFLTALNKQLNALVNSVIYIENKERLDSVLKSKSDFRTELLRLLKTNQYKDFYKKIYFDVEIYGNKAKYFRTVIEEYRRILLSRSHRQTIIAMIKKHIKLEKLTDKSYLNDLYRKIFDEICSHNDKRNNEGNKLNWISKAEFNNIIKEIVGKAINDKNNSEAEAEVEIDKNKNNIDVYAIDYSSEDRQISEFILNDTEANYLIEFKMKYSNYLIKGDSLLTYQCKVPKKQIKGLTTGRTKLKKITRPKIFLNTNDNKLYISFNYELMNENQTNVKDISDKTTTASWLFKTMGIDIGVAKSATAAIMTTSMCWQQPEQCDNKREAEAEDKSDVAIESIDFTKPIAISNELTVSEKAQSLSNHIEILKEEQEHIYKKEKAIADLLKLDLKSSELNVENTDNSNLFHKYQRLNKLRLHLRSKVSNLKRELSFLTARDMISHAIDNNVDLITLEKLSWIRDEHHTTWDYNQIQQRIIHEASVYGIKVKKVACAYSSVHNPLTLEKDEVDKNRKLVKCLYDRDYAAAIILARRGIKPGLGKKKLQFNLQLNSHINDSFQAVNYSIKPSLQYRQLKLCEQKSIIRCSESVDSIDSNFVYYNIL